VNKAFTKDDTSHEPVLIPPRAPLPEGLVNYVTPRGLSALREELRRLEQARLEADALPEDERTRERAMLSGRIQELEQRIVSATLIDPSTQQHDRVRFGARVRVLGDAGERTYEIVGVDEADAGAGKLAFTAPLARALLGKTVGESAAAIEQ
jgi:transcription elongation factor GreB